MAEWLWPRARDFLEAITVCGLVGFCYAVVTALDRIVRELGLIREHVGQTMLQGRDAYGDVYVKDIKQELMMANLHLSELASARRKPRD